MKKIIVAIILFCASVANSAQTDQWIDHLEKPRWQSNELKTKNFIAEYLHYDFSPLLKPKSNFLGYIDPNYKRIKIHFKSISKNTADPKIYTVEGFSEVGSNRCDFSGEIKVGQIREYKQMHFGIDDEFKDAGFKAQGLLIGEYNFKENPSQKHSGSFEGIMTLYWLVDKTGNIKYDDIELSFSDGYENNQYIGTWSNYGRQKKKTCNWGEYRIPFSGDLDIGAGEFGVNPKYYNQGWEDFKEN
jgi:hypothetical protein